MKFIRGFFRYLGIVFLIIIGLAFVMVLFQYLTTPIYRFPEPKPFSGPVLFNPYRDIDSLHWRRANFQVQSYAWGGLTDGRKNTNEAIDSVYRLLQYDVRAISDYQKINRWGEGRETYIPVYEHGYNMFKRHQVLIGASKVNWQDYPLFQTLDEKQHILNILRRNNKLIFIAHPKLRDGYEPSDMKYLTGYDGIEVLNYMRVSIAHWDSALTAGRYVTVMGNDDSHDISRPIELGHRCTYIYSPSLIGDSIISALKSGKAYAADIFRTAEETLEEKIAKVPQIAKLKSVTLNGDTMHVSVNQIAREFRFIGQEGRLLGKVEGTEEAFYVITPEDTYVRTEIEFPNRNIFYLNPIVRTHGETPSNPPLAVVDPLRSWIFWIVSWATVAFIIVNIYYFRRRFRKRKG